MAVAAATERKQAAAGRPGTGRGPEPGSPPRTCVPRSHPLTVTAVIMIVRPCGNRQRAAREAGRASAFCVAYQQPVRPGPRYGPRILIKLEIQKKIHAEATAAAAARGGIGAQLVTLQMTRSPVP